MLGGTKGKGLVQDGWLSVGKVARGRQGGAKVLHVLGVTFIRSPNIDL
jgi:hypothetical protein